MVLKNWQEILCDVSALAEKIDWSRYNSVYGIPKSGLIVTQKLLQKAPENIEHRLNPPLEKDKKCLVVDDLIDSGRTLRPFIKKGHDIAVLYNKNKNYEPTYQIKQMENEWIGLPWENKKDIEDSVTRIIEYIGEDPNREGLKETPKRIKKFYDEWMGYDTVVKSKVFTEEYDNMVIVGDIDFYSLCEHHMLPFKGKAHIGYIPNGKVIGLSKIARILNKYAHRLQIQERIGKQIADEIEYKTNAKGVMVVIQAEHLCMGMRGIKSPGHQTTTSEIRGVFREDNNRARQEFLELIK